MHDDQDDAVIGRLDREREQAERRYVAALTALDAAAEPPPSLLASASAGDADLVRLNQVWRGSRAGLPDRQLGLFRRVLQELARMLPWRRRALNGAMLAAINRQAEVTRAVIDATRHFQSHVVWYAQTIAGFAATQRRSAGGVEGIDVVRTAVDAMATDWHLRWDALQAREQRYEARTTSLTKAYEELREVAALAQENAVSLRRTVEALARGGLGERAGSASGDAAVPSAPTGQDSRAFTYVAFEDRFRGSPAEIRQRLADYVRLFAGTSDVVDIGCGRGELLELLREHGVPARGIDLNEEMVALCRSRGLTADRADAMEFLAAQPEGSVGGVIAIQVVEHLEPPQLMRFIDVAHRALKPGALLVLETINAACWAAFFDSYIRDFTHARPLHPETLRFLIQAAGFKSAEIQFRSPFAEHDRLPIVALPGTAEASAYPALVDLIAALNAHAERLNARLFTYRDYAIIARR